jgi:hypothetical protein
MIMRACEVLRWVVSVALCITLLLPAHAEAEVDPSKSYAYGEAMQGQCEENKGCTFLIQLVKTDGTNTTLPAAGECVSV